jgi:hypothetical protein
VDTTIESTDKNRQLSLEAAEREMENMLFEGQSAYLRLGAVLQVIREGEYYKGQYSSFEAYCNVRWPDISFRTAQVLIQTSKFYALLPDGVPLPYQKSLRALAPLTNHPTLVRQAWSVAQREHGERNDRGPVESEVRRAVRKILGIAPYTSTSASSAPTINEHEQHLSEAIQHLTWLRDHGDHNRLHRVAGWITRTVARG